MEANRPGKVSPPRRTAPHPSLSMSKGRLDPTAEIRSFRDRDSRYGPDDGQLLQSPASIAIISPIQRSLEGAGDGQLDDRLVGQIGWG